MGDGVMLEKLFFKIQNLQESRDMILSLFPLNSIGIEQGSRTTKKTNRFFNFLLIKLLMLRVYP